MLIHLHIRNLALIDEVDLTFPPGMTALTGETGAGKSILVDALGLVLGDRADSGVIRYGQERAEVTALFDIRRQPALQAWLKDQELDVQDDCLLRRLVGRDGRSRGYVNAHPVTVQILQQVGARLVDIHSQHEHQSLLRSEVQRTLLDEYAGCQPLSADLMDAHRRWHDLKMESQRRRQNRTEREAHLDLLRYQVQEFEALRLADDDVEALEQEHARLQHARHLLETSQRVRQTLYEDDGALLSVLGRLRQELESLQKYDARLGATARLLQEAAVPLEEAASDLRAYGQDGELDPARLAWTEERLQRIHELARKHRVTAGELAAHGRGLQAELAGWEGGEAALEGLDQQVGAAAQHYHTLAARLSAARQRAAEHLSGAVSRHLPELGLPGGRFAAALLPRPAGDRSPHGLEQVEFQVSANPGQPLAPLARVASGGELSRISLAIQMVAAHAVPTPTLIFDEVDVGVGGGTAEIVGRALRALSATHQVLCVTHLPQVAALAHHHLRVSKQSDQATAVTTVAPLSDRDRQEEIARMLGGVEITRQTRAHAREMIDRAREEGQPAPS